ncbi:MAG TPA: hypothetical protein PLO52_10675 [Flavobacterium alvei]|nr:hypothetical protein [Flavobacterium alvei]HQK40561.1 hypothetical protein [Flavobacterium alvei]
MKNLIKLLNSNIIAENSNNETFQETLNPSDKDIIINLNYDVDGITKSECAKLLVFQNKNVYQNYTKWSENSSLYSNGKRYYFTGDTYDFLNIYVALIVPYSNEYIVENKKLALGKLKKIATLINMYRLRYLNYHINHF